MVPRMRTGANRRISRCQFENAFVFVCMHTCMCSQHSGDLHPRSPLSGRELVARKVRAVGWMGGKYPNASDGEGEWNFSHDGIGPSTKFCVDNWPRSSTQFLMFRYSVNTIRAKHATSAHEEERSCFVRRAVSTHCGCC